MSFTITSVDGDDIVVDGQTDVVILCEGAGNYGGDCFYGGVEQQNVAWTDTACNIPVLDAGILGAGEHSLVLETRNINSYPARDKYRQADYTGFAYKAAGTIDQAYINANPLIWLGEGTHTVNNPITLTAANNGTFIHGVDKRACNLYRTDDTQPLFIVDGCEYVNFTSVTMVNTGVNSRNVLCQGSNTVCVDVVDSFVDGGTLDMSAPGQMNIQGTYIVGRFQLDTLVYVNHVGADVVVLGGNFTDSGRASEPDNAVYKAFAHAQAIHGRLRIYGTGMQWSYGAADVYITSATVPGKPHIIAHVRSEGNNGEAEGFAAGSCFVLVPTLAYDVDVDIVNSAGSWGLSGDHLSTFAEYDSSGTLRLLGNSSTTGGGTILRRNTANGGNCVAIGNMLSQENAITQVAGDLFLCNLVRRNLPDDGAPYTIPSASMGDESPNPGIVINIEFPTPIERPAVTAVLPGMVSVTTYGATGNGSTDDTAAIQAALDDNAHVYFPAGTYLVSDALYYNHQSTVPDYGEGGFFAGAGSATTLITRADGPIFATEGMAYATWQGIGFASSTTPSSSYALFNLEWVSGVGHATQSNSFYDLSFSGGEIGINIGNTSPSQCSENIFVGFSITDARYAVSIGGYNALGNLFISGEITNAESAIGHYGVNFGGTWALINTDLTNITGKTFNPIASADNVFLYDNITAANIQLFEQTTTGATYAQYYTDCEFDNVTFIGQAAGGAIFTSTDITIGSSVNQSPIATHYIINNTPSRIAANVSNLTGGLFSESATGVENGLVIYSASREVTLALTLDNETVDETGDGATLTIDSTSDAGTLWSYSKTTPFTGTDEENAAEIIANGVGQSPVIGTNTRIVTGQDPLTPHYAGWVQDTILYGDDMVLVFNMGAGETLTIPAGPGTYLFDIDWGDGTVETGLTTQGAGPHTYTDAIEAVVRVSGAFPHVYFMNSGDIGKLIRILNWGDTSWSSANEAFAGASNLVEVSSEVANTSAVTDMYGAMWNWTSMTSPPDLSLWDTSSVTNMSYLMFEWTSMTSPPDLSTFDTSNVTDMTNMMRNWTSMTSPPDLSTFDTSKVTTLFAAMYQWNGMGEIDIALDLWQIPLLGNAEAMLLGTSLTTECLDSTYTSWGAQAAAGNTQENVTAHFGSSNYTSAGAAGKQQLLDKGWTITDSGEV